MVRPSIYPSSIFVSLLYSPSYRKKLKGSEIGTRNTSSPYALPRSPSDRLKSDGSRLAVQSSSLTAIRVHSCLFLLSFTEW